MSSRPEEILNHQQRNLRRGLDPKDRSLFEMQT